MSTGQPPEQPPEQTPGQSPPQPPGQSPRPGPKGRDTDAARILLVRPTALGDVARTVPCLASLRAAFPGARIDWLVHSAFVEVVRHHPMLDGVVPFDRQRLSGFGLWPSATRAGFAMAKALRRAGYTHVYDLQGLGRSGLAAWLTRAPHRAGFADAREYGWLGYNRRLAVPPAMHTVDRMLGLLRADGIAPVADMRLYVGDYDRAWAQDYLEQHGLAAGRYVCLAPTAQWGCKCWPAAKYAELAGRVVAHEGADTPVVLLAAPHEHAQLKPITDALGGQARVPKTTVGQLMALIAQSAVVVANDSAALHLAVGLDRPVVGVFGPTDPALVGPYRRGASVVQPAGITPDAMARYRARKDDNTLIAEVSVEVVWEKLVAALRG